MNNLLEFVLEINISLVILYAVYWVFFERDRNFQVRRIFLLCTITLPLLLALIPYQARIVVQEWAPLSLPLEGVTFSGTSPEEGAGAITPAQVLKWVYLAGLFLGFTRLIVQVGHINRIVIRSKPFLDKQR